jgi:hypothetical protein
MNGGRQDECCGRDLTQLAMKVVQAFGMDMKSGAEESDGVNQNEHRRNGPKFLHSN